MKNIVFDIEANGLAEFNINKNGSVTTEATRIHLLVLRDFNTDEVEVYREANIVVGYRKLMQADLIIGHNSIMYDLPVLRRLHGPIRDPKTGRECKPAHFDTLVAARLLWPDRKHHPHGGNSLEALGKVIGCPKDEYSGGFDEWNQEMEDYCIQDTASDKAVFKWLRPKLKGLKAAVKIEHRVAEIIAAQQDNGVCIDLERAEELIDMMELEKASALDVLHKVFAPRVEVMKKPAYYWIIDNNGMKLYDRQYPTIKAAIADGWKRKHVVPGPLREKHHDFNPGSPDQVAERLKEKYGWIAPRTKPSPTFPNGKASVTEIILQGLDYPEAEHLLHYNMAEKRLQHLSDWVRRARECRTPGIIHPAINTNGCNTGRMAHSQPNQTAPPKVRHGPDGEILMGYPGRYGIEMRTCWGPKPGMVQVGCDASGLELRMLGDQLARFDGGAYAKVVAEGDIHTLNMKAGGLQTRDQAKTTIYAFLYGAGDEHIGVVISKHPSLTPEQRKQYKGRSMSAIGKAFRKLFLKRIPGIEALQSFCRQAASERGYLTLLDGRKAPIRAEYSALNVLLQGNGAIVMKLALIHAAFELDRSGYEYGFMLNCHDEFQLETPACHAEQVGEICVDAIREAGVRLKVACPLTGEYKIGKNWSETH